MARLRDRRHLHRRRGDHAAGRGLAAAAGDPDDPALRSRHHRRARGGAETGVAGRAGRRPLAGMTGAGFWRRYAAWSLDAMRSEEHTSELQSLMRISYAVFCLKKKKHKQQSINQKQQTLDVIRNTHEKHNT